MTTAAIFCSSSEKVDPAFLEEARKIGQALGKAGIGLVFGGTNFGMMREVASGARDSGGTVTGYVPELFRGSGRIYPNLDRTVFCRDLSDRKAGMIGEADVLVALPGGIGTLDEAFSAMAGHVLGYHRKKIIFYNFRGFWTPLISFLMEVDRQGFVKQQGRESWLAADSPEGLVRLIATETASK
ncbi:MAG: TIGR00730 family Rossman fold protein [Sutterellaceae bacterium]|nr:TIGR00730 family Rossman fold protein [Sutterellaceae bacterium]MDD7443033.1 TIGR00730 family Rossman fold protein [Sutterellaceae bacterium]MDY2867675.1 TIGR00730 family Rossman fold protein [Mesosutterella sp.]